MRRKRHVRALALRCELPEDVLTGCTRATMTGKSSVMIEGQHGVVEMGERCVRLRTGEGILTVAGEGLVLQELSLDAAMIVGVRIDTLTYMKP